MPETYGSYISVPDALIITHCSESDLAASPDGLLSTRR